MLRASRILQQLTPNIINAMSSASSASVPASAAAATVFDHNPFASKPATPVNGGGELHLPMHTLRTDSLPSFEESARLTSQQLLPFNYGRALDPSASQHLVPVGHATKKQLDSGAVPPKLFQPLEIRGKKFLKNRIVVSPMCQYSSEDGFLNDWHLVHLGQFAIGGAGMIIVEATAVSFEGRISPTDSGLWKDEQIEPLRRIAEFLKSQDCVPGIQIAHAGRKASTIPPFHEPRGTPIASAVKEEVGGWPTQVIAPSARVFADDYWLPKEMNLEQIQNLKAQFVASAKRAIKAGFRFIELHAAHGYLLSEFLSPTSNHRTDAYGGSFLNRIRLLLELAREVRDAVGPEIVLGVRLTCNEWVEGGWTQQDTNALVSEIRKLHAIDIIDCSSGGNSVGQKIPVVSGYQVPFAEGVKQTEPEFTVAAVGLITDAKQAESILQKGQADLIFIAREFLRTPNWPLKAARELGYDVEWAPQYQRAKPSATTSPEKRS